MSSPVCIPTSMMRLSRLIARLPMCAGLQQSFSVYVPRSAAARAIVGPARRVTTASRSGCTGDEGAHARPHFHARYSEYQASVGFDGEVVVGWLPSRALAFVEEWALLHADELQTNWDRARDNTDIDDRCSGQAEHPVECGLDTHARPPLRAVELQHPAACIEDSGVSFAFCATSAGILSGESPAHAGAAAPASPPTRPETQTRARLPIQGSRRLRRRARNSSRLRSMSAFQRALCLDDIGGSSLSRLPAAVPITNLNVGWSFSSNSSGTCSIASISVSHVSA